MLITVEEKTAKTIDLELPAYYQWKHVYAKIINKNTALVVKDWEETFGIMNDPTMGLSIAMFVEEGNRITEKEFLDAFHRVGEKVKRELIKAIETDGWKAQEQAELKANALAEVETTQS